MDSKQAQRFEFFCPFCCSLQKTNTLQKITLLHHAQILTATLVLVYVAWPIFGIKGITSYLFFWMVFEFVYRLRKRKEFVCRNCGFDPFLYRRDIKKTRHEVQNFLQQRILAEGHFKGKKLKNYQTILDKTKQNIPVSAVEELKINSLEENSQESAQNISATL